MDKILLEQDQNNEKSIVEDVLRKYANDSLSYFHLQEKRRYFFSPSGNSFLSYRVWNKVAIVAADPVGPKNETSVLIKSFVLYAKTWKVKPFFVGLSDNFIPVLDKINMRIFKLGEEAILDLLTFNEKKLKKKVRRTIRHAENMGLEVFFCNPRTLPKSLGRDIHLISKNWLANNGNKEKGFAMTLGRIPNKFDTDCQFAIAIKNTRAVGFLCFAPVYNKRMISLDISRRKDNKINGLTEFLIIKSAIYFKEKGVEKISLNFATFEGLPKTNTSMRYKFLHSVSSILKKLYRSDSLHRFNQKFLPTWRNRYIAFSSAKNLPFYLIAILRAER